MSQETRKRVQEAAERMGYVPNATGRALATGRTHLVSLWINNPYTPYYASIGRLLHAESERRGYHPIVRSVSNQSDQPAQWEAADSLADGVLTVDVREPIRLFLKRSPAFRRPLVSMGALCLKSIDHVELDLYRGAVEAVEHLVSTRDGRIVAMLFREDDPRSRAYLDVMLRAGRQPELILIPDETRATNRSFVRSYIQECGCPAALFCQNDDTAIAAYRALVDLGIRVPDDVALVGCDGIEDGEYLPVPISTIIYPSEEMAALAWRFLENRMANPALPQQSAVLRSRLQIRQSSAVFADSTGAKGGAQLAQASP